MGATLPSGLYDPLQAPLAPDGRYVLGRITQSLDGRIATASGDSRWISGHEDVVHTHRLRSLFDAVVVGAGTVRADDPQLTTREVEGRSPVRVVIDTNRRLSGESYHVFRDGPPTLLLCADDAPGTEQVGIARVIRLPRHHEGLDIESVVAALTTRGLRRIYVEGGGITVSRFLAAGALDRLHVTISPLLIGSGIPAFTLPTAAALADGIRLEWTVYQLGHDLLVDVPIGRARPGNAARR